MKLAKLFMLAAPLGAAALVSCVDSAKPVAKEESTAFNPTQFTVEAPPKDLVKLDVNLGDKVTLLGYTINYSGTVKPGQKINYKLYWKVEKALGENGWRLFTHVLNSKHKKLLNIDNVGPLRDNGKERGQAFPPSKWQAGKIYVDTQTFNVPKKANGDVLKIVTGIWKGKNRLEPKSGPHIDKNRALVTTLNVGRKKSANTRVPDLRVDKLEGRQSIKIDGKLDEPAWANAPSTGKFVNVRSGAPDPTSKVQGSAKMLWNDKSLFIAFEVEDQDIVGGFKKTEKDPHLWTKDCVEIMIDPDGDGDNNDYYEIQVSPQNLVFDSQFDEYNKPKGGEDGPFGHQEWSAKLKSAVRIDGTLGKSDDKDKGYTVEIELPWSSFTKAKKSPPAVGTKWRMNFYAMENNGGVAWSPILGQGNFHKASRFGRVLFADKDWVDPKKAKPSAVTTDTTAAKAGETARDKNVADKLKAAESLKPGADKAPTPPSHSPAPGAGTPTPPAKPSAPIAPKAAPKAAPKPSPVAPPKPAPVAPSAPKPAAPTP